MKLYILLCSLLISLSYTRCNPMDYESYFRSEDHKDYDSSVRRYKPFIKLFLPTIKNGTNLDDDIYNLKNENIYSLESIKINNVTYERRKIFLEYIKNTSGTIYQILLLFEYRASPKDEWTTYMSYKIFYNENYNVFMSIVFILDNTVINPSNNKIFICTKSIEKYGIFYKKNSDNAYLNGLIQYAVTNFDEDYFTKSNVRFCMYTSKFTGIYNCDLENKDGTLNDLNVKTYFEGPCLKTEISGYKLVYKIDEPIFCFTKFPIFKCNEDKCSEN